VHPLEQPVGLVELFVVESLQPPAHVPPQLPAQSLQPSSPPQPVNWMPRPNIAREGISVPARLRKFRRLESMVPDRTHRQIQCQGAGRRELPLNPTARNCCKAGICARGERCAYFASRRSVVVADCATPGARATCAARSRFCLSTIKEASRCHTIFHTGQGLPAAVSFANRRADLGA
jgi:hypothetical protein